MMHGHTKIELTNVHTGEVEVIEKDNIVTNAVSQIFNGPGSQINAQRLLLRGDLSGGNTLKSNSLVGAFYGGLLLYDKALGSDPNTFFAPVDAHIVGCGVYDKSNTGLNKFRGSCNKLETKINTDEGVATFVYDFATSQGNGTIASVCLTNILGGYMSETPGTMNYGDGSEEGYYTRGENYILEAETLLYCSTSGMVGDTIQKNYGRPVYLDPENDKIVFAQLTSDKKLIIRTLRAEFQSVELFQNAGEPFPLIESVEYDVSALVTTLKNYSDPLTSMSYSAVECNRVFCDIERRKWYLVCAPSTSIQNGAEIKIREFDMTANKFEDYSITNTTGETLNGAFFTPYVDNAFPGRVYDGHVYLCGRSEPYQIYRVSLIDPTDVTQITMNGLRMCGWDDAHDGRIYSYRSWSGTQYTDRTASPGVILNTETGELYQMEARSNYFNRNNTVGVPASIPIIGNSILFLAGYGESSSNAGGIYTPPTAFISHGLRRNYLGTINDLPSPVEKTADKTMKITYTLRRS